MLSACAVVRPQLALVACPTCSATNFELFRFCQLCGVPRPELVLPPHKSVNWSETEQLADFHANAASSTAHETAKDAALTDFGAFCASLSAPCHAAHATPRTVVLWLAHRASSSSTAQQLHAVSCARTAGCGCPRRLGYSYLKQLLGKLRFHLSSTYGLSDHYADSEFAGFGGGNPAASREVDMWVSAYEKHQRQLGSAPSQATPVIRQDVEKVVRLIDSTITSTISSHKLDVSLESDFGLREVFSLLVMKSFCTVDCNTGQRGGDLSQTLCQRVVWMPNRSGLIFSWVSGKTFRDANVVGTEACDGDAICGCAALQQYATFCSAQLGWDMSAGFLWPAVKVDGPLQLARLEEPYPIKSLGIRFKALTDLTCPGERSLTLSGIRSGTAIRQALQGDSLLSVMERSYWRSPKTALHYLKIFEVLGGSGVKRSLDGGTVDEDRYREINEMPLGVSLPAFGNVLPAATGECEK
jgi:hypothetical protein